MSRIDCLDLASFPKVPQEQTWDWMSYSDNGNPHHHLSYCPFFMCSCLLHAKVMDLSKLLCLSRLLMSTHKFSYEKPIWDQVVWMSVLEAALSYSVFLWSRWRCIPAVTACLSTENDISGICQLLCTSTDEDYSWFVDMVEKRLQYMTVPSC